MKRRMKSLAASFKAAGNGIARTVKHERNMRIHIVMAVYVILFGLLGKVSPVHWAIFFLCFAAVISAELVNTALERVCDTVDSGFNISIGIIKDLAAGAVLVSALCSAAAGLCIFLSPAVFGNIMSALLSSPWLLIIAALTLISALVFIFKKS